MVASAQVSPWLRILITRSVALVPTLLVVFITSEPNKLDVLNQWLNILQSVQLVFAVLPVRRLARAGSNALQCSWLHFYCSTIS